MDGGVEVIAPEFGMQDAAANLSIVVGDGREKGEANWPNEGGARLHSAEACPAEDREKNVTGKNTLPGAPYQKRLRLHMK